MLQRAIRWFGPMLCLLASFSVTNVFGLEVSDAEILALEISGELLPPPSLTAAIQTDLDAIRSDDRYFERIHAKPDWAVGEILVGLTSLAWQEYQEGRFHGLDELNATYGPVDIDVVIPGALKLTFTRPYHPVPLADIYSGAEGIHYVEPNVARGDGNDISSTAAGEYTFRKGWGDCPAGCTYEHFWEFSVVGGQVTLIDERGTPLPEGSVKWK